MKIADLRGKRVAIWGFGVEGRATIALLQRYVHPASITVMTDDEPAEPAASHDVPWRKITDIDFGSIDVVIKSPGVSPLHRVMREQIQPRGIPVTGGSALWFEETGGDRTIAVTGSKGKSTTSSIAAHLLASLGHPTTLAGNVGRALLDVLDETLATGNATRSGDDWYVVEMSSYQASELRRSPQVGVLTTLFPEHLDWHGSVEQYYRDKCNLFAHRADINVAANADNPTVAEWIPRIPNVTPYGVPGGIHVIGSVVCDLDGTQLVDTAGSRIVGRHNAVNLSGALTALRLAGVSLQDRRDDLHNAVQNFRPLAHRLEPVGEHRGRLVIDDSLSTAPQAAVAALNAFADRPVGIIVGGHDRGLDYQPLADALAVRSTPTWVCGVPLSGERIIPLIERTLAAKGTDTSVIRVRAFDDFDDAVHHAEANVPSGGVLLLSPAAPSFGRFKNYVDRGMHFRSLLGLELRP